MAKLNKPRFGGHMGADEESSLNIPATRIPYGNSSGDGTVDSEADLNYDATTNTVRVGVAASLETIANGSQVTISGTADANGTDSFAQLNLRRKVAAISGWLGKVKWWLAGSAAGEILMNGLGSAITAGSRMSLKIAGDGTGQTVAGVVAEALTIYESGAVAAGFAQLAGNAIDGFFYLIDMAGAPANNVPTTRRGSPVTIDVQGDRLWYWGSTGATWLKPNQDLSIYFTDQGSGASFSAGSRNCYFRYSGVGGDTCNLPVSSNAWGVNWGPNTKGRIFWFRNDSAGNLVVHPAGTDTIDGVNANITIAAAGRRMLISNGNGGWLTHTI